MKRRLSRSVPNGRMLLTLLTAICVGVLASAGVGLASTPLTVPLNNNTAPQGTPGECTTNGTLLTNDWHFVISPNNGSSAFVTFHLALVNPTETYDTSVFIPNGAQTDNVFVAVPSGHVLTDLQTGGSTADISWDGSPPTPTKFQLSHICGSVAVTPTVVTQIHLDPGHTTVTEVALGDKVHDSATVSSATGTPTGSVDFKFYSGPCGDDSNPIGAPSTLALVNGVADPSAASPALAAGSYHYTAHYNSDNTAKWTDAEATCEPLTVDKAQLSIVTQIHNASHDPVGGATDVPLGSVVHDTATVSGAVPNFPIGAVTFTLNGSAVANDPTPDGTATARSEDSAPLAAGSYTYKASVAGNANYIGATSADEPLMVDKARLSIVTQIHNASHQTITNTNVPVGTVVHDTATVSGAVPGFAIGAVSFTLNGSAVANDPAPDGTATARSADSAPLAAGSYTYRASVAGNANYIGATSADEPLSVRTFGKTMGFWGNTNGQASLPDNPNVTLGTVSASTCSIIVNTKAISKVILPNTKNGVSILTNCTTTASRDPGINTESLNTLLAQTLALSFNILYIQGYTGQTIGGMNCTPVGSLTLASTVQAARDYANGLIANASLGGTVVTQSQIGALNTLLGCLNRES